MIAALDAGAAHADQLLAARVERGRLLDLADDPRGGARPTLAAHLEKLGDEGRLPEGVEPAALTGPSFGGV